ncbi:MAG: bifunctional folylpolyglutamate synthase/dihydrofolate synthase [Rikenellaceae bacterium]|nr:bifunctional folylpolyglutamate synthase/dihydrofolate synthase [Rikenellaceae bacterium]
MNYRETIDFLYNSLPVFQNIGGAAYNGKLDKSDSLDEYLGFPHKKFMTIHVAGTNGKGSVSHMLTSILMKAGYKTGLYTSPHLYDFRERIRVNGEMISENEVVEFVKQHWGKIEEIKPSFFEMTVFMAFDHFARHNVDIAVIEVGMGGRLDSTNVITPVLSVITNIGTDHTQFLGDTKTLIAGEKAGIIKNDVPVVIGETDTETAPVFIKKAGACGSEIVFADDRYTFSGGAAYENGQKICVRRNSDGRETEYELDLAGRYQRKNILTVLTAIDILRECPDILVPEEAVKEGLRTASGSTGLYGRWQIRQRHPTVICDTAHNKEGLSETMAQLGGGKYKKLYFILGVVNDKELDGILPLFPKDAYYFFTQADIHRALDAEELYSRASAYGLRGEVVLKVSDAVAAALKKAAPDDFIYVGGSTFVVAEVTPDLFSR